jgi:hypothetical protein
MWVRRARRTDGEEEEEAGERSADADQRVVLVLLACVGLLGFGYFRSTFCKLSISTQLLVVHFHYTNTSTPLL